MSVEEATFEDIARAIRQEADGRLKIGYTIEFFPEEGKYHWSGHRMCNVRYTPQEIRTKGVICPVCHKPLTVGVENRVLDLSARSLASQDLIFQQNHSGLTFVTDKEKKRRPFVSIIPLMEILAELNNGSQIKAFRQYHEITSSVGTEFDILLKLSYDEIEKKAGTPLRDAVQTVRERKAYVDPGYDGVFGVVKLFKNHEKKESREEIPESQQSLF